MAEQRSLRGDGVTSARFTGPFEQHLLRFGINGLNLHDSLDALVGWSRLTNVESDENGELTARPGQTVFATGGTTHHSIRKLRDPATGGQARIWGVDTNLYFGTSGALSQIDSGYSGDPLTLVPHRPPLSGAPWMFVADRSKMRKVRSDGLDLPIGLPAPGSAATVEFASQLVTDVASFDAGDSTDAAAWTPSAGTDANGGASDAPQIADETGLQGNTVAFTTAPGAATSAYDSWWGVAAARNLNTLQGGGADASDEDLMHFWLQMDQPDKIEEIRLYVVVSPTFDPAILPGTDETGTANTAGYVKAIRQNDFAQYMQAKDSQINVAESALLKTIRDQQLENQRLANRSTEQSLVQAQRDPARTISLEGSAAAREWVRYGYFEIPLRRGDFQRFGTSAMGGDPDWGTITGLVIYVRVTDNSVVTFRLDDWFLHGGYGVDSTPKGSQPFDWRYTHYDTRTGCEGNPSPVMAVTQDADRKSIIVHVGGYGDGGVHQRIYRRGGSLIADWYFCGENSGDGADFIDNNGDNAISAAGTLQLDHYAAVPTVNAAGDAVLGQPLPALWGPLEGMLMGCGDPYRPGHVYNSIPDEPDHWSALGVTEVCPPSEELLNGGVFGHQAFVFSRERLYLLYPNLSSTAALTSSPSLCKRGPVSRWAFCTGPGGIYFVTEDGVYVTSGGPEEWISRALDPLFKHKSVHGYFPIDFTAISAIRCSTWENKLYVLWQDTKAVRQCFIYDLLLKQWRHAAFGQPPACVQGDDEDDLLIGGAAGGTGGRTYTHTGTSDAGAQIACVVRTGAFNGGLREEKLFGDQFLDTDTDGATLLVTNYLNEETVTNATQTVAGTGRARFILDGFGEAPQKAHSVSTEISWASADFAPILYQIGYAVTPQPDITIERVTNWDDLNNGDEFWLSGVTLDCDTGGEDKTVLVERDFGGVRTTVATLTVNSANRHKRKFSWAAVPAHLVRLRPTGPNCERWMLYRADWISQSEPPRIARWDIHFENLGDQYYTGLDLYCDTGGLEKRIEVAVDGVILNNPSTGLAYFPITTNGRRLVHLTLPWGRGHVFRFRATDDNEGLLYSHKWYVEAEPAEQANWNQNFSILGTRADKWMKALVLECDTYGQNKSVTIEADGVVVDTLTFNATGRKVIQKVLTDQKLGRVWRMFPVDGNPGRLYSAQPIFDEEPFALTRWETQELNYGMPGWFYLTFGHIVLKSSTTVTLTVSMYDQTGNAITREYDIPSTQGQKQRQYVTFKAVRGALVKFRLDGDSPFYLYRDETQLTAMSWGAGTPTKIQPFGNDDLDVTRTMTNATFAAQASGGGTA